MLVSQNRIVVAYTVKCYYSFQFAVLLGIVFILEISAGIAAYIMRDKVPYR